MPRRAPNAAMVSVGPPRGEPLGPQESFLGTGYPVTRMEAIYRADPNEEESAFAENRVRSCFSRDQQERCIRSGYLDHLKPLQELKAGKGNE